MKGKKLPGIQALRGVAVLLVLMRHLLVMEDHFGGGEMLLPEICKAGDAGVDLFFVISGFIMVVVSRGRFQTPGSSAAFLYNRATRIYPLYWFYSIVILIVALLAPVLVPAMKKGQVDLFSSFLLLPHFLPPLLGQGWTLTHEIYFYLLFSITLLLPERRLSWFLLLWGLAVAVGYNFYSVTPMLSGSATIKMITNPTTVEFVLGGCVALAIQRGFRRAALPCLIGGALLLPASSLFFDPLQVEGLRFFCFGLPSLLILYGAASLEGRSPFSFSSWLQSIGDASFSIYLTHILVITAVGRIWMTVRRPGLWDNALALALMAAFAVACGFASYRWIEQPLLRATRFRRFHHVSTTPATSAMTVSKQDAC